MPDDSNPRIAVLGAGPIGLETALYARYLGYPVELFKRAGAVAANLDQWGHVRLFSPFHMNATPLGVAAVTAQDVAWQCPDANDLFTGRQFRDRYLLPLSNTDLLTNSLRLGVEVAAIGRSHWLKGEVIGNAARAEAPFRLLCRTVDGLEQIHEADVVVDCTGTYGNHNWLGQGGIPAVGELATAEQIEYSLPDVLGGAKERYAGKHTLVVGAGYSAATTVALLAGLANRASETRVTWSTRTPSDAEPIPRIPNDRLAERDALAAKANQLAANPDGVVTRRPDTAVESIEYRQATDDFAVTFSGEDSEPIVFDRIVANVGYRPDGQLYEELQIHQCYASDGPMKLAAQLLSQSNGAVDCLQQTSAGPQSLLNPEPSFFILGSKSYGRSSQFLLSIGFKQIRDLFTLIGQRDDLDLYATMPQLTAQ